ncbi:MAG: N-acetylmuramoyl-L-alanine amidase [Succinivibrio sp.]|nr:N-acetylmuramoyl-L-alanine amidase [Succinivibrio sp.]
MRAYSNHDKTRIVLDLDDFTTYTTAQSRDGASITVRVKNVTRPKDSPQGVTLDQKSAVKKVVKSIDGKDVRYTFSFIGGGTPHVFTLAKKKGSDNFRIVIDFPHTYIANTKEATDKDEGAKGENKDALPFVQSKSSLQEQEHDLFVASSTQGPDGLRRMSPAQAREYNEKLKELRARYAKQQAELKADAQEELSEQQTSSADVKVPETVAPPEPTSVSGKRPVRPFVIAIDPGHGGKDPGAIGRAGVREKNVTLAISKALYNYINSDKKFKAVLTRSSDKFIDLSVRSEIARKHKADILISIHADSVASESTTARGISVWVLSNNRAQRENKKMLQTHKGEKLIGGAGTVISQNAENPYLAATILDMSSSSSRSEGYLLGNEILNSLGKFTRLHRTSPIHASLAVLKAPDIPSLLIETGFLSNVKEEKQLSQPNYQKQVAYHIYQGIESYYTKYPAKKIASRQASAARHSGTQTVKVKKGESLSLLAKRYGTTVASIRELNGLKNDQLKVGQTLVIRK